MLDRLRELTGRLVGSRVQSTGTAGERAAERFLVDQKRLKVVARNWRHGRDELDLVCLDREILVFVEVKTRQATARVPGYYTVDRRKKKALQRVIRAYRNRLSPKPYAVRFDVVEVEWRDGNPGAIRHFENVPLFSKGFARSL